MLSMQSTPAPAVRQTTYPDVREERSDMQRQQQSRVNLDLAKVARNLFGEFEASRDPNVDNNGRSVA